MDLQGRAALVTGGARRLGRAIALALGRSGANVMIHYHSSAEQAEEVAAEEISRERNRELARRAAEAEAAIDASGFTLPNRDLPPGF